MPRPDPIKDAAAAAMLKEQLRMQQSAIRPRPDTWTPGDRALWQVHHVVAMRIELLQHAIDVLTVPWDDSPEDRPSPPTIDTPGLSEDAKILLSFQPEWLGQRGGHHFFASPADPENHPLVMICEDGSCHHSTVFAMPATDVEARNPDLIDREHPISKEVHRK